KNEFYFYWIVPGSYHVTVMATDPETGQAYPATADFEVQAPAVRLFAARTRKVSVLHAKAGGHVFAFGGKEACDSGNGILWNYRVQAPSAAGGRIGMTEILTDELRHDGVACTIATKKNGKVVNSYPADGTTEALDGAFWYDHADEVAAGATTPTLDQVDFPHTPLTNKGLWSADFR